MVFIAFVICWVDLTARIRRRRSMSEGIGQAAAPFRAAVNCSVNSLTALVTSALS